MENLDRRLHPVRSDVAARSYEGKVKSARFVDGVKKIVRADRVPLKREPRFDVSLDTEVLYGETFTVYDDNGEGWAWGQLETDGYVGWVPSDDLADWQAPTHRVWALRTYRYPAADLRFPPLGLISMGSLVTVVGEKETRGLKYAVLADGSCVVAKHLMPVETVAVTDWVSMAEAFLGTPYLWGGRSSLGLDCSALVQVSAQAAGLPVLRDTDMQQETAGIDRPLPAALEDLQRGDLIFWKGHVGIMRSETMLLHANGYSMMVSMEPIQEAIARIGKHEFGEVTAVRRLLNKKG